VKVLLGLIPDAVQAVKSPSTPSSDVKRLVRYPLPVALKTEQQAYITHPGCLGSSEMALMAL
jgi:hypothetical protein